MIHEAEQADEGEYVCSVSALKRSEIKHEVRIRGELNSIDNIS